MTGHRLEGLESDNLLAFLAALGLLRCLERLDVSTGASEGFLPRLSWDIDNPPVRPRLHLSIQLDREEVCERAAEGLAQLASFHEFDGRPNIDYSQDECRAILSAKLAISSVGSREYVDLLAALMSDGAIKDEKDGTIDATPLCLMFGQGHQHFLERLSKVPQEEAPPARGRGKSKTVLSAAECLFEALFEPWKRVDPTPSFRWDPEEDVRYALMAGDPTDAAYKTGTQHGANRLAAIGLACLTLVPVKRGSRIRASVVGGKYTKRGFSFSWPIWRERASLRAVLAMLNHPSLRETNGLRYLGVTEVMVAQRVSSGKFMNFTRARPISDSASFEDQSGDQAAAAD